LKLSQVAPTVEPGKTRNTHPQTHLDRQERTGSMLSEAALTMVLDDDKAASACEPFMATASFEGRASMIAVSSLHAFSWVNQSDRCSSLRQHDATHESEPLRLCGCKKREARVSVPPGITAVCHL
jgi:hypothetical protein